MRFARNERVVNERDPLEYDSVDIQFPPPSPSPPLEVCVSFYFFSSLSLSLFFVFLYLFVLVVPAREMRARKRVSTHLKNALHRYTIIRIDAR